MRLGGPLPRLLLLSSIALLAAQSGWAFSGAEGAAFLEVPVGAAPAGLGNAYSPLANDAYAPVYNPAGLGFLPSTQVALMHQAYVETTSFEFLSFVHPFSSRNGMGFSVQYFRPGEFDATDASGNFTGGQFGGYYAAYSLAFGQKLTDNLSAGITGKLITAKIDDVSASAYAGDAGLFYRPRPRLTFAAVAANMGSKLKFIDEGDPLPMAYRLGGSYRLTDDLRATVEGSFPQNGPTAAHIGVEWPSEEKRGFCIRTGYSTDRIKETSPTAGVTVGVGIPLWGQEISYTWMPVGEFGHSHYFSLVFKFGQVKQAENVMTGAENPDNSDAMPSSDYNLIDDANRQNPNAQ